MKSIKNKLTLLLILFFLSGTAMIAQPSGARTHGIPGLSEDQKAQIHKLRISHLKDIQALRNQIGENRAHFKTLMSSENPDMNAINKNIDEFGSLRTQIMKKQAANIQDIRKLLNDEQRLIFDRKMNERLRGGFFHAKMRDHEKTGMHNSKRRGQEQQ